MLNSDMIAEETKWKTIILGDYIQIVNGHSYKSIELKKSDNALVTLKSINRGGGFNQNGYKEYVGKYDENQVIKNEEIVMAVTDLTQNGEVIGKPAIVKHTEKYTKVIASLDLQIIRSNILSEKYIYYLLLTDKFHNYSLSHTNGTTVLHLNKNAILKFKTNIPQFEEQQRIVKILSCLDSKIELLQRMNETLKQIGNTIFKSWFVDFDGILEFEDSEFGIIPKGWTIKKLDKVANFVNGLPLQKFRSTTDEYLPVIKIREIKNGISNNVEKARIDLDKKYIVENGDILFSWSGTLEVTIWNYGRGAVNQHIFKIIPNEYEKWFCYKWIQFHLSKFRRIAEDKRTTMGHIQRHHLSEALVLIPHSKSLNEMNTVMNPIFELFVSNNIMMQNLIKMRDLLLPKLMSGEIRV